jgi:hypothetical protein
MKRSSLLWQLYVILHALLAYNQCFTCRVEHIEHISANIYCRGKLWVLGWLRSLHESGVINKRRGRAFFLNRTRPLLH